MFIETKRKIRPALIKHMELSCPMYDVQAEAGTKYEEVLNPSYWAHFALKARVHDILNVRTDDLAWRAILTVTSVGEKWVKVFPMLYCDMRKETMSAPLMDSLYEVKLRGPKRWSIIRKEDREIMKEDIGTEKEAWQEVKKIDAVTRG